MEITAGGIGGDGATGVKNGRSGGDSGFDFDQQFRAGVDDRAYFRPRVCLPERPESGSCQQYVADIPQFYNEDAFYLIRF